VSQYRFSLENFFSLMKKVLVQSQRLIKDLSGAGSHSLYAAEADRSILQSIVSAYITVFHGDPLHPEFMPFLNNVLPLGCPCPDFVYAVATIHGSGVYRLSGTRGTVRTVFIHSGFDRAGFVDVPGKHFDSFTLDDLAVGSDGTFSVILSTERPDNYIGDWRRLDPRASYIDVRQCSYDWINEIDARIAIERLDAPITMERITENDIAAKINQVLQRAYTLATFFPNAIIGRYNRRVINSLESTSHDRSGWIYYDGMYIISEDEALVFEVVVPASCTYWSVQLYNELSSSTDYVHRQSSLNGHTAFISSGHIAQIVLSAKDPNILNWLDISGYPSGGVMFRFMEFTTSPAIKCSKVRFCDLAEHLIKVQYITADRRTKQSSDRRIGAQLRKRW
jgi:hypothetical protein